MNLYTLTSLLVAFFPVRATLCSFFGELCANTLSARRALNSQTRSAPSAARRSSSRQSLITARHTSADKSACAVYRLLITFRFYLALAFSIRSSNFLFLTAKQTNTIAICRPFPRSLLVPRAPKTHSLSLLAIDRLGRTRLSAAMCPKTPTAR